MQIPPCGSQLADTRPSQVFLAHAARDVGPESEPGRTELTDVPSEAQSSAECNYAHIVSHLASIS